MESNVQLHNSVVCSFYNSAVFLFSELKYRSMSQHQEESQEAGISQCSLSYRQTRRIQQSSGITRGSAQLESNNQEKENDKDNGTQVRGRTRCIKWNNERKRTAGIKPLCQISEELKRIVGDNSNQFITELGHRIRTMLPLRSSGWKDVDIESKERLFDRIKAEWNLPDGYVQIVERQCQAQYRQWRFRLKEEFFVGNSIAAAVKNCPKEVDPDQWKWIVEKYWGSENQKVRSRINQVNRSKQKLKATQGSRSTARVLEMLRKNHHHSTTNQASEASHEFSEAGNEPQPEYITLWETTKRHKDHSMDRFAEEKLEEFKQLHHQQIEEYGVDNLTVEEAYMKVLGTSSGYIKGLGFGPKPPKRRKDGTSYEEYASLTQQMVDQFDNIERASREREHKLNEQIQELQKDKDAMLEVMEKMKKDAAEREARMMSEILEMVKQQLQSHK